MIIIGYSGQVSIGQSFFFGLGAYVTAWLGVDHGWNFLLTLPVSAALGFAIGFLVGIPALRIRGLYLALVTLALAAVFPVLAKLQALESITGGANGKPADTIIWKAPGWVPGTPSDPGLAIPRAGAVGAVVFLLASNMMKSRPGRSLIALRDSEVGAAVSGVWPAGWKVGAFAISAAYGAVGGSMLVFVTRIAAPETGGFATAIALLTGAVLGGLGTISGAVIGALAVTFVPVLHLGLHVRRRLPVHPGLRHAEALLVLLGGRRPDPGRRALRRALDRRRLRDARWHRLLRAARALEAHPLRAQAARRLHASWRRAHSCGARARGSDHPSAPGGRTHMRKATLVRAAAAGSRAHVRRRRVR